MAILSETDTDETGGAKDSDAVDFKIGAVIDGFAGATVGIETGATDGVESGATVGVDARATIRVDDFTVGADSAAGGGITSVAVFAAAATAALFGSPTSPLFPVTVLAAFAAQLMINIIVRKIFFTLTLTLPLIALALPVQIH
ncbi:MAG: hypothetical protein A3E81_02780 [Gammaproteobacteria bacterium RIFCSPHIGHO2_12_FULL_36_30]|nr:MAG: hypothetical protein A3E81_02780 [Gammaproteobacteria bacterium RIFCSPHIGHO2_12_FULL_36_30]